MLPGCHQRTAALFISTKMSPCAFQNAGYTSIPDHFVLQGNILIKNPPETQSISSPALANPVTVVAIFKPDVTRAENANSKRVCGVTAIDRPVVIPELIVPMLSNPVKDGDNVTDAPGIGVKVSFGVVERYSCAVIVTVEPMRVKAAAVLK